MNTQLKGFMNFVRSQGVIGLAVGLAIGTQVGKTVDSIVNGLIDPVIGFIIGNTNGLKAATLYLSAGDRAMKIGWGAVVSSLITLLAVSALIYYVVMGMKLDKVDAKKEAK